MQSYKLLSQDVKLFMPKLLTKTTFDNFEIRNVTLNSFAQLSISSILKKDEEVLKWEAIRPYVCSFIKGHDKPSLIKIIFGVKKDDLEKISDNLSSGFLNLTYENDEIIFTTGTSQKNFNLEKLEDRLFDEYIEDFFKEKEIFAINIKELE